MKLDDINDELGTEFHSEDYDSIGGIMIELLDRFPKEGESIVTSDGITLTAEKVDNNRIETVIVLLPDIQDGSDVQEPVASSDDSERSE